MGNSRLCCMGSTGDKVNPYTSPRDDLPSVCSVPHQVATRRLVTIDETHNSQINASSSKKKSSERLRIRNNEEEGLIGLKNLGRTSCINAVIQSFNGIDLFQYYFVRNPRNKYSSEWTANNLGCFKIDWKNRTPLTGTSSLVVQYFQVILVRLLRQKYKRPANEVVVNPGKFVKFVREWQGDEYNIKGEEDAGFLFTELLDLVHTVLNRASDKDREYWKAQVQKQLITQAQKSFSSDKHLVTKDRPSILELSNLNSTPTREIESRMNFLLKEEIGGSLLGKGQQAGIIEGIEHESSDTLPRSPRSKLKSDGNIPLRRAKTDLSDRKNKSQLLDVPSRSQSTIILPQSHFDKQALKKTARYAIDDYLIGNRSIVVDLFLGQVLLALKCRECKAVTARFDSFFSLTLSFPTSALLSQHKSFKLKECFKEFSRTTRLEGQYCESCNEVCSSSVSKQIWMEPNVLVLKLNRFKGGALGFKYKNSINYPIRNLKLDQFMTLPQSQGNFYDLASVICHEDNMTSGTSMKIALSRLYNVKKQQAEAYTQAMVNDAYILIYEKIVQYVGRKEPGLSNAQLMTTLPNEVGEEPSSHHQYSSNLKISIVKPPTGKPLKDLNKGGITESTGSQTRVIRFTTSNGFGKQSFMTGITTPQEQQVSQLQRRASLEKQIHLADNSRDSVQEM